MTKVEIRNIIDGCIKGKREYQKLFYEQNYRYGIAICLRYSYDKRSALNLLNISFFELLNGINKYKNVNSFDRVIKDAIIANVISQHKKGFEEKENLVYFNQPACEMEFNNSSLTTIELLSIIQQIPYKYRIVYNLNIIDDFTVEAIAGLLGVNVEVVDQLIIQARISLLKLIDLQD